MTCDHDFADQEIAIGADGMCPLCQAERIALMRRFLGIRGLTREYDLFEHRVQAGRKGGKARHAASTLTHEQG